MYHLAQAASIPRVFPAVDFFVLAVFVGYFVLWSVTPALHTPLIRAQCDLLRDPLVGALLAVGVAMVGSGGLGRAARFVALILRASISLVASGHPRMRSMYQEENQCARALLVAKTMGASR